ncbi:HU family DNA-binding protein [Prevotella histicola]|uniref:HU family DNA-binding protein n=1 Tax=Prevotella histicola TaxID=470565 RepID=UPI0028EEE43C|nr:HU family DNA-binding protein [Prevotella histicola]
MRFKLVQKKNPQKREEVKFYANPVNVGHKSLDDIACDIAGRSSLTRGDVSNVLYNFIDCLPHYLRDGFSIQLGNFGSMRVTLSSKGSETEKAFKTETIKPRVVFTPGTELKRELAANSYESLRKKEEEEKSLTPVPSPKGEGSEEHPGPQAG